MRDYNLGGHGRINQDDLFNHQPDLHDRFIEVFSAGLLIGILTYFASKLFGLI